MISDLDIRWALWNGAVYLSFGDDSRGILNIMDNIKPWKSVILDYQDFQK